MSLPSNGMDALELRALSIFFTYIGVCLSLTLVICRDLRLYYLAQPSSKQRTRLQTFCLLACISLLVTWYYMIQFFSLSYRVWAYDHAGLWENHVRSMNTGKLEQLANLRLGAWLKDVQLFRDAWETATETNARLFWSQPIFFITAIWSLVLADEGKSWKIRRLWAYMLLGQIVAISFAANLFFIAILLVQSNSGSITAERAGKTSTLLTLPLQGLPAILTATSVMLLPSVSNTAYYMPTLALPHLALFIPLLPLFPRRAGTSEASSQNSTCRTRLNLPMTIAIAALCVQLQTLIVLVSRPGESRLHRHSRSFNTPDSDSLASQQGFGLISQTIGALYDHPAVTSVGWDALLSGISLVTWAMTGPKKSSPPMVEKKES